jgi:alkanesulfonate monooxygenase SsuD/methylene tetrahydromethanopterin reductase-like flavin-dependent oxidoreductase (luciferase family)
VLGSDDPVRVFEQFAALDLVSTGRAEIMVGRGALTDSFRLFGHDLGDYDALFDEKLRLLLALRAPEPVTWSGRFRPPLNNELIVPRPVQEQLPVWIGGGGSPNSVVRAASLGLPLVLGTISGTTRQYVPMAELYREALEHYGKPPQPMGFTVHGFVADTSQQAAGIYSPAVAAGLNLIAAEQGIRPFTAADIEAKNGPGSTSAVGSPSQVVEKLLDQHELLGHQRAMLGLSVGPVPHREVMRAIELLGTEVAPVVRAEVARRESAQVVR